MAAILVIVRTCFGYQYDVKYHKESVAAGGQGTTPFRQRSYLITVGNEYAETIPSKYSSLNSNRSLRGSVFSNASIDNTRKSSGMSASSHHSTISTEGRFDDVSSKNLMETPQ